MPHYRDPVHGFIEVSPAEQKIVDSAPFQRLRNIHQLATTYLVYHGAEAYPFWAFTWCYAFGYENI